MEGCLTENTVLSLIERRLSAEETDRLHEHVDRCPACLALLIELGGEPMDPGRAATLPGEASPGAEQAPAAEASLVGDLIEGYRILHEIGRGAMGAVYEAVHERIGQRAAVKVLFPRFSGDPQSVRRFRAEARAASAARHPGLVTIFNHGELPTGAAYLMMELLAGESLKQRLLRLHQQGQRVALGEVLRLGRQVASALCAVHQGGIVHRDLKPANVMIVPDADVPAGERARVVDFGIVKWNAPPGDDRSPESSPTLTARETFIGTVAYASPEQCQMSDTIDGKSDVYSLGIMLYEMLAGQLPFQGSVPSVMGMHVSVPPRPLRQLAPAVPAPVAALVHDMLAKEPAARPSMQRVWVRLDRLRPEARSGAGTAIAVGAGLVALAGAVAVILRLLGWP